MPMKKLFLISTIILLLAAGCKSSTSSQTQDNTNTPSPTQTVVPTAQTYLYLPYDFQFTYPLEFGFTSPTYANLEEKIVQLELPQSAYPHTNFGDAGFTVSAGNAQSLNDCLSKNPPPGGRLQPSFQTSSTINGVTFYQTEATGAAAGNLYESKVYRTLRNNLCLELNATLHTSNISNYPKGTVSEVDKTAVWSKLDSIIQSFKFN